MIHTPGPIKYRDKAGTIYECGCVGDYLGAIALCPLHAAAPEMRAELERAADTFRDFAMANRALYRHAMADTAGIAEQSIRALLTQIDGKE